MEIYSSSVGHHDVSLGVEVFVGENTGQTLLHKLLFFISAATQKIQKLF